MQNEQIVYWVSNDVPLNGRIELAGKGSGLHNIVIADWTICTNLAWVRSEFSILFLFFFVILLAYGLTINSNMRDMFMAGKRQKLKCPFLFIPNVSSSSQCI